MQFFSIGLFSLSSETDETKKDNDQTHTSSFRVSRPVREGHAVVITKKKEKGEE